MDVVHRRGEDNAERLLAFFGTVDAKYRGRPGGQVLRPTRELLLGTGHHLLSTNLVAPTGVSPSGPELRARRG